MAKCEHENCTHEATHSVTLNIPTKGVQFELHPPIKMYIGVELCREHAKDFGAGFDWEDNLPLKQAMENTLAATGRIEVDFDRTFHAAVHIDDPGYQQFLKVKRGRTLS